MVNFSIKLNSDSEIPVYQQLVDSLRNGIESGLIESGATLPSTRDLSECLGVSRKTVNRGYDILQDQGWINVVQGKVPMVKGSKLNTTATERSSRALPLTVETTPFEKQLTKTDPVGIIAAFHSNAPAVADLPLDQWRRCLAAHVNQDSPALAPERDPRGHIVLRRAIAEYVKLLHGVICDDEDVAILTEARQSVDLIARLFLEPGDIAIVENPGGRWVRRIFEAHGAIIEPVSIDDDGLCVDKLELIDKPVKLIYVTPSHHDPTGAVMSLARREALMNWANSRDVLIIEDHTDSQYRYTSGAIPALHTFDREQSVIYISSFWKVLYPLAPFGLVVFPKSITPMATSLISLATNDSVPKVDQCVLADFIRDGHLEKHVRKMTKVYAERRKALLGRLTECFGSRVHLSKESAGLLHHIKLELGIPDDQILECAEDVNLKLITLAPFYFNGKSEGDFLIPFGSIEAADLEKRVQQFADNLSSVVKI